MTALAGKSVYVAGHNGMVGRAIVRRLAGEAVRLVEPRRRIDLRRQSEVEAFMAEVEKPAISSSAIEATKVVGPVATCCGLCLIMLDPKLSYSKDLRNRFSVLGPSHQRFR